MGQDQLSTGLLITDWDREARYVQDPLDLDIIDETRLDIGGSLFACDIMCCSLTGKKKKRFFSLSLSCGPTRIVVPHASAVLFPW